jgi:hypothetical protein
MHTVSGAGDVNSGGYGDVIVGADQYDNGQNNEGRAYAYYSDRGYTYDDANRLTAVNGVAYTEGGVILRSANLHESSPTSFASIRVD